MPCSRENRAAPHAALAAHAALRIPQSRSPPRPRTLAAPPRALPRRPFGARRSAYVSLGAVPAAVTRVYGTPWLVSAACQAAVVGSAEPSPINSTRRLTAVSAAGGEGCQLWMVKSAVRLAGVPICTW